MDGILEKIGDCDSSIYEELKEKFNQVSSLEQLVRDWIEVKRNKIGFYTAYDSETGEALVQVAFSNAEQELATLYLSHEWVTKNYPQVQALDEYYIPGLSAANNFEGKYVDSEGLDEMDSKLGVVWNDLLCENAIDMKDIVPYALSFAISRNGEAVIDQLHEARSSEFYEDPELRNNLALDNIYDVIVHYQHHKDQRGWGSAIYGLGSKNNLKLN